MPGRKRLNGKTKGNRKRTAAACALLLPVLLSGCMDWDEEWDENSSAQISQIAQETASLSEATRSSLKMQLTEDGSLTIERPETADESVGEAVEGETGTWTIFAYMCGSDLESESGLATSDIDEMISSCEGENVRFVVQTGGAEEWQNWQVDANTTQRYVICDGEASLVDEQPLSNMGESQSLADFLTWGVTNYPAEKMGVILWNHGGGSVSGVCFDEQYAEDSLSLREMDAALLSTCESTGRRFELIGFDACLMGTVECANVLASYANYMVGSQEMENGYGWDYETIGAYLTSNPSADGAALGTVIADSYYETCVEIGEENTATMSVTDLSKIDQLVISFNTFAQNLYNGTEQTDCLTEVVRNVAYADNFGGNNVSAGYTNMMDLGGFLDAAGSSVTGIEEVQAALTEAVIYTRNGSNHESACGLSLYYPIQIQSSAEMEAFGDIAISPYYLSFVDRVAYGAVECGDFSAYDNEEIFDSWGSYEYEEDGSYESADEGYWDYYEDYEVTGESPLITFSEEPYVDENGRYCFVLSEEGLQNAASVQASVYMISDDLEDLIDLGISTDIYMDWSTGTFADNFDGNWFSLPNGEMLAVYMISEGDGFDVYSSPVEINGEETNLIFTHDYVNDIVTIDGIWDGVDENGMSARATKKLRTGDTITPLYDAINVDTMEDVTYYDDPYTYEEGDTILFECLMDGEYLYGFYIDDIYGDYYETDYVNFTMECGEPYYSPW